MPAKVIVIGLDAAEATLIERWAGEGILPGFARLTATGSVGRLGNCMETLPGAIWPELNTGRSVGRMSQYYHPAQLHTGEAKLRPILEKEVDPRDNYWDLASQTGQRVALIDIPQAAKSHNFNGIQLIEWGLHDRFFGASCTPPELLHDLPVRLDDHPIRSCDDHGDSLADYDHLLTKLLKGVERKTDLLLDLMERENWDLFNCAYGETHCVGHQFWHFQDSRHPRHDPHAPQRLRGAIRTLYQRVDEGVAALIRAAGPKTTVLVFSSHGMGHYIGGYHLLPEVLVRLGMSSSNDAAFARRIREAQVLARKLPKSWKPALKCLTGLGLVRKAQESIGGLLEPLESPMTRAVALYNNRCGAIRLNLKGREPCGRVEPGPEAAALIDEIRCELLALKEPKSDQPIVSKVVTASEAFGLYHHRDLPDLMVVFRTDLGLLETCLSDRVGTIHVPQYTNTSPRTGDHTIESRIWIKGPGVFPGRRLPDGNVLDLAPTVLQLLGVPIPNTMDGQPLPI